jgi:hypothetical protein
MRPRPRQPPRLPTYVMTSDQSEPHPPDVTCNRHKDECAAATGQDGKSSGLSCHAWPEATRNAANDHRRLLGGGPGYSETSGPSSSIFSSRHIDALGAAAAMRESDTPMWGQQHLLNRDNAPFASPTHSD